MYFYLRKAGEKRNGKGPVIGKITIGKDVTPFLAKVTAKVWALFNALFLSIPSAGASIRTDRDNAPEIVAAREVRRMLHTGAAIPKKRVGCTRHLKSGCLGGFARACAGSYPLPVCIFRDGVAEGSAWTLRMKL